MQKSKADRIAELRQKRMANKGSSGQESQATKYLRNKPTQSTTDTKQHSNLQVDHYSELNNTDIDKDSLDLNTTDIDKLIFFKNLEVNNESLDYAKLNLEMSDDDLLDTNEILPLEYLSKIYSGENEHGLLDLNVMNGNSIQETKNLVYSPNFEIDQVLDHTTMDKDKDFIVKPNHNESFSNEDLSNKMNKLQDISNNFDDIIKDLNVTNNSVSFENASSINNQHIDSDNEMISIIQEQDATSSSIPKIDTLSISNENDVIRKFDLEVLGPEKDDTTISIINQVDEDDSRVYEPSDRDSIVCDELKMDAANSIKNGEVDKHSILESVVNDEQKDMDGTTLKDVNINKHENADEIYKAPEEPQQDYKTEILASINKNKSSKIDAGKLKTKSGIPTTQKLKVTGSKSVPIKDPKMNKSEIYTLNNDTSFNETVMDDFNKTIRNQQNDIKTLNSQLNEHKIIIESQSDDITGYLNQIKLLETALNDEQKFNKSNINLKIKGPHISESEAMQLSKEINEQEFLIKGLVVENEKLVQEVKESTKKLKEEEQLHLIKIDALQRDKSKMNLKNTEFDNSKLTIQQLASQRLKIEDLESELGSKKHIFATLEVEYKQQISKVEAQLKESLAENNLMKDSAPEKLKLLKSQEISMKDQFTAYICELEVKLEFFIEKSHTVNNLTSQNIILQQSLVDLNKLYDSLSNESTAQNRKSIKRAPSDIRIISELEAKLKFSNLELDRISKSTFSITEIIEQTRPSISNSDHLLALKQKLNSLMSRCYSLNNDIISINDKEKINDNEIQIKRLQNKESNYILDMKSLKEVHEKERLTFVTKIGTLNTEMKSISLPITSDDLSNEETFSKLGSRINLLRHRVSELEVLVDQMQARNNQLMMDKNHLQTELSTQIHEKDDIIVSYESKIMILQKDIHDRMTFIDEPQRIQTLHNLMKESEAKSVEIASLMMKLEISEGTRKAVNETTKYILQQTHEDTTRLVNDQHGRTFELIKSQMLKDSNTKESKLLESQNQIYTVRFNQLQDQLLDVKGRYSDSQVKEKNLREQMENLEASLSEAKRENILLVDSLEISKNGWSPSMHKFDELSNHIRKLERDLNDREEKLSSFLLDNENCSHQYEINELLALLGEKDDQIRTFKKEMQYIVNGIIKLKKAIPHKMG